MNTLSEVQSLLLNVMRTPFLSHSISIWYCVLSLPILLILAYAFSVLICYNRVLANTWLIQSFASILPRTWMVQQQIQTESATGVWQRRKRREHQERTEENGMYTGYSLSVIMPAHNEEVAIAGTVRGVIEAVSQWTQDFEVIVVNDGSKDSTQEILESIAAKEPHLRIIRHEVNKGYGAALVSGFEAISKELAFFMDSDGQFDIRDLERFFPLIEKYDAVLGYRVHRQDTWLRKLNAFGWKMLIQFVFKLRVRDIDCAFKLYRAQFFQEQRLETRGAMINTEILYKFTRAGYSYTQVGVHHLPRKGGQATGAKPAVIARAFYELFQCALKWHREERQTVSAVKQKRSLPE